MYFIEIANFGLAYRVLFNRYQLMLDCWQENPDARPTFTSLRDTLKEMEQNHVVSMKFIKNLNLSCWLIYDKDTVHFGERY